MEISGAVIQSLRIGMLTQAAHGETAAKPGGQLVFTSFEDAISLLLEIGLSRPVAGGTPGTNGSPKGLSPACPVRGSGYGPGACGDEPGEGADKAPQGDHKTADETVKDASPMDLGFLLLAGISGLSAESVGPHGVKHGIIEQILQGLTVQGDGADAPDGDTSLIEPVDGAIFPSGSGKQPVGISPVKIGPEIPLTHALPASMRTMGEWLSGQGAFQVERDITDRPNTAGRQDIPASPLGLQQGSHDIKGVLSRMEWAAESGMDVTVSGAQADLFPPDMTYISYASRSSSENALQNVSGPMPGPSPARQGHGDSSQAIGQGPFPVNGPSDLSHGFPFEMRLAGEGDFSGRGSTQENQKLGIEPVFAGEPPIFIEKPLVTRNVTHEPEPGIMVGLNSESHLPAARSLDTVKSPEVMGTTELRAASAAMDTGVVREAGANGGTGVTGDAGANASAMKGIEGDSEPGLDTHGYAWDMKDDGAVPQAHSNTWDATLRGSRDEQSTAYRGSRGTQDMTFQGPQDLRGIQDHARNAEARDAATGGHSTGYSQKAAEATAQDGIIKEPGSLGNPSGGSGEAGKADGMPRDSRIYPSKAHSPVAPDNSHTLAAPDNRYSRSGGDSDAGRNAGRVKTAATYSHFDGKASAGQEMVVEPGAQANLRDRYADAGDTTAGDGARSQTNDVGHAGLHDVVGKADGRISFDHEVRHLDSPPSLREIAHQIVERAALRIRHGDGEMVIQLRPESLGRVHVMIAEEGGSVTIGIRAENGITRDLLEAGLSELKSLLADNGVKVNHVNIAADTGAWDFPSGAGSNLAYSRHQSQGAHNMQVSYIREAPADSGRMQPQAGGESRMRLPGNTLDRVV